MQTREADLLEEREIINDYLTYLQQHSLPEETDAKGDNHEMPGIPKEAAPLSSWRNALTGVFYNGKHARFILRDILAGHAKNNFFFNVFKKSKHANFIALIDRIAKLDVNPKEVFEKMKNSKTEENLLDVLFDYFMELQANAGKKNDVYYSNMKALKRDIHHFAKQCGIKKRIIRSEDPTQYKIQEEDQFNQEKEDQKEKNRQAKTRRKRIVKVMAFFMGVIDVFVVVAGFLAIGIVAPVGVLVPLIAIISLSALTFGYLFAKNELFELSKQIFLGRIFQVKNLKTGQYETLKGYQKALIVLLSPFSLVAGFCCAALVFAGALSFLTFLGIGSAISIPLTAVSFFVFCLVTATYFLTIKTIISHLHLEKLIEYKNSLTRQENESYSGHGLRLFLEITKWAVATVAMLMVAIGGYYLFKDKSIKMLGEIWKGLSVIQAENIAKVISLSYSTIKMVFGTKKIMELLQQSAEKVKQTFFSQEDRSEVEQLNPIQQKSLSSQNSYKAMAMFLLSARSIATGGYYHEAAVGHHFQSPNLTAATATGFIYAINAIPFLESQAKQEVTPHVNLRQLP
ncbi:MAG: hypothetical protein K0S63_123 [Gammaproteobacteria bacterium]|jgi:hypothetical protein|nr:hypothetical protein [Gammaproteobacteria bacterium]